MAYIRDYTVTEVITASTNPQAQVEYPVHETNDVILLMMAVDGTTVPSLPSGYTDIQNQAGAAQAFRLCYKVAASSSETCPTLSGASDEWHIVVIAVAGADYADPINFSGERTVTDAAAPFTWTSSLSTDENNVLIFQFCNSDSGLALTALPNYTNLVNGDSGTCGVGVAYTFQPTSGSITDCTWIGRANDDTTACAVGINDDGNGTRPGYSAPATVGTYISALGGTSLIQSDTNPASLTFGAIGMRPFSQFFAFDGTSTYTDDTTDINDVGTADVTITNAIGAIWYFGYDYKFNHMVLNRSTASSAGTIVWEYYNGSTWSTLTVSGVLTATGWVRLSWTRPTDWTSTSVNSSANRYWVRMRVSATFTTAPILTSGAVGGWLTTYDAVANVADAGVNPYNDVISLSPAQTTNFSGSERQFGTAKDMDTGIVILHHKAVAARDYAVDPTVNDVTYPVTEIANGYGGYVVVFGDASGYYEAYSIHGKQSLTADYNGYNVAAIGINNSAEKYGTYGGTLDKSAVSRMLFLPQGQNGAMLSYVSGLSLVSEVVFAGGDSTNPLDVSDLRQIANCCVGTSYLFLGTGDFNRIYAPIQFGGSHEIKTLVDGAIFQFPTKFDGKKYFDWNVADDVAGVSFYGLGSGDWLKFPNCTWKGSQPYRWEFDASHSASTVMDFTGNTVIGATVTLQSTVTLSDIKFQSCPTFTLNSANISEATFVSTTVTAGSPGSADNITDSSFTSSGTGHAMVITGTAADLTLTNLTFTGYAGTDGSTGNEAIYFNIASGTINLTIDGGTNPSVRTAGATINKITNPVSTTITVRDIVDNEPIENARVLVYAADNTGPLPSNESVTITRASSVATVSHTAHGIPDGSKVLIKGANQPEYNGVFTITVINSNSYSYTVVGTPATPATGTILATGVVIQGLTDQDGIISDTRAWSASQPVVGRVRRASAPPPPDPIATTAVGSFDTNSDKLSQQTDIPATLKTAYTVLGWFKRTSNASQSLLLTLQTSGGSAYNTIYVTTGGDVRIGSNLGTALVQSSISLNTWYFFALTQSGATRQLTGYVGGAQTGALTSATTTSIDESAAVTDVIIGGGNNFGDQHVGSLTEVRIYDIEMSAAQVEAERDGWRTPANTVDLIGHYPLVDDTTKLDALVGTDLVTTGAGSWSTDSDGPFDSENPYAPPGIYYKTSPVVGTVDNTAGLSLTIQMIRDE